MHRIRSSVLVAAAAATALLTTASPALAGAGRAVAATPTWRVVPTVNVAANDVHNDFLEGVSATAANDAWAVGNFSSVSGASGALIEHWNGTRWQSVKSPAGPYSLHGVAAIAANNVWAVGENTNANADQTLPLLEHFNGTAWSVVQGPDVSTNSGESESGVLTSISALSATDIWAAGWVTFGSEDILPLFEHFNGTSWQQVATPLLAGTEDFFVHSISADGPNDVWAVGENDSFALPSTLTLHWNGSSWSVVQAVTSPGNTNFFSGVVALSPSNVWAVGEVGSTIPFADKPLIEHFDGSRWTTVTAANASVPGRFFGVVAVSASDIWAVGDQHASGSDGPGTTMIQHFTGRTWSAVPSPNGTTTGNVLFSVAAAAGHAWAAGVEDPQAGCCTNTQVLQTDAA